MRRAFLLLSACALLLSSCDGFGAEQDQVAGGFGSETTNGVMVTGPSEVGTVLVARRLDRVEAPYRTGVDSTGTFRLRLPPGSWSLVGTLGDQGFVKHLVVRATDSVIELGWSEFKPVSAESISGWIEGIDPSPRLRVWLPDIGLCVPVDSQGGFQISNLPWGPYLVRLMDGDRILAESFAHTCFAPAVVLNPSSRDFLLEDFDDGDVVPRLDLLVPGSSWMVWGGLEQDSTRMDSLGVDLPRYVTDTGAASGKSLHVPKSDPRLGSTTLALVFGSRGFGGEDESFYDLSGSDSLVFRARGTGNLVVQVRTRPKVTTPGAFVSDAYYSLGKPGADWQRFAIAWKDFQGDGGFALGDEFRNRVVHKILFTYADGDLWLDDIGIIGGAPSMFLR